MQVRKPSPAMVVALIALFISLGGSGYAAVKLNGKNIKTKSIAGTKLRDRTITAKKVKKNSLGGTELKETAIGKVPSAAKADSAANAGALGGLPPSAFERSGRVAAGMVANGNSALIAGTPILHDPRTGADVLVGSASGKIQIVNNDPSLKLEAIGISTRGADIETRDLTANPGGSVVFDMGGTEAPEYLDLGLTLAGTSSATARFSHLTCSFSSQSTPVISCVAVG